MKKKKVRRKKELTPTEKWFEELKREHPEFAELMLADAGKGTSQLPSDNVFELDWHWSDPAWAWLDALYAYHARKDHAPLFALAPPLVVLEVLNKRQGLTPFLALVPEHARWIVEDYLVRFIVAPRRGPKTVPWMAPTIERGARMMIPLIKAEGLTVEQAAERVLEENRWLASEIAREKPIGKNKQKETRSPQDKLEDHFRGDTGHGYRWKNQRP